MFPSDAYRMAQIRQRELLREAEADRLALQRPLSKSGSVRSMLAARLHALANWLEPLSEPELVRVHQAG